VRNLVEFFSTKQLNTLNRLLKEGRLIPKGFDGFKCQQSNNIKKQIRYEDTMMLNF
jgi:hypothetical protein